jgi:hypothetical protein
VRDLLGGMVMKSFKLNQYPRSVTMVLRQIIIDSSGIDRDKNYPLDELQLESYLSSPGSHSVKSVGPKTIEFICKEFDISPPDAWKIRIDKYHEDRKDKDERKIRKERYVTVKINQVDAEKLLILLQRLKIAQTHEKAHSLLDKIINPLKQKFDIKD